MQQRKIYTEIQQQSYDALVRTGTLEEVLLALMTDPLAAEDVADELEAKTRKMPTLAPSVFADLGANVIDAWRITIAQWVMTQVETQPALRALIMYDRRLGVWCACRVVREALRFVPDGEDRPRRAIETTEAWIAGKASIEQVSLAGYAARDAAYATSVAAWAAEIAVASTYAAAYAAWAADEAVSAAYAAARAADAYATSVAYAYGSAKWNAARDAELVRFRKVVANACMTFPDEAMR